LKTHAEIPSSITPPASSTIVPVAGSLFTRSMALEIRIGLPVPDAEFRVMATATRIICRPYGRKYPMIRASNSLSL